MEVPSTVINVLSILFQAIGGLALVPILTQQATMLTKYWKYETGSVNSTRVMLVTWCSTILWISIYRIYSWWHVIVYEAFPEWGEWGGLLMSLAIFGSAVTSLVAFWKRQRELDRRITEKLKSAGLQRPPTEGVDDVIVRDPSQTTKP